MQGFIPIERTEVRVEEDDVLGFADIVEEDAVTDIKSIHSFGFNYMGVPGYDVTLDKKEAWLQVCYYALMLGKKQAKLVFVSKDDLRMEEFAVYTQSFIPKIEAELKVLREIWKKGELPPAQPRSYWNKKSNSFKECKYCRYLDRCKQEEEGK